MNNSNYFPERENEFYNNDNLSKANDKDSKQQTTANKSYNNINNVSDLDLFEQDKIRKDEKNEIYEKKGFASNLDISDNDNICRNHRERTKNKISASSNLITLKNISVCQSCKEDFNSDDKAPYLLKCGHFFCKNCLENNYTDEKGRIYCPDDGVVANEFKELKLLNNLILERKTFQNKHEHTGDLVDNYNSAYETNRKRSFEDNKNMDPYNDKERFFDNEKSLVNENCIYSKNDKNNSNKGYVGRSNKRNGYCDFHPDQKLSHFIEETREAICVHCAFLEYKKINRYEILELSEKCNEIISDIDFILGESQLNEASLHELLKELETNKAQVQERINLFFDGVTRFFNEKKNEIFEKLNFFHSKNFDKIYEKVDALSARIVDAKESKGTVISLMNGNFDDNSFEETFNEYYLILKFHGENSNLFNFEIDEISFFHEEENKFYKAFPNFADLKLKNKFVKLQNEAKKISKGKKNKAEKTNDKNINMFYSNGLFSDFVYERNNNKNNCSPKNIFNSKENVKYYIDQYENKTLNAKQNKIFSNPFAPEAENYSKENRNSTDSELVNFLPISKNPLFAKESSDRKLNKLKINTNSKYNDNYNMDDDIKAVNKILEKNKKLISKQNENAYENNTPQKLNSLEIFDTVDLINNHKEYVKTKYDYNDSLLHNNTTKQFESRLDTIQRNAKLDYRNDSIFDNDSRILYKYEGGQKKIYYEPPNKNEDLSYGNKLRYKNHSLGQITKDLLFNNAFMENRSFGETNAKNYDSRSFNRKNQFNN